MAFMGNVTFSVPPVALVTGSSRGLGRGVAEVLAEAGYSVAIHYARNKEAAAEAASACAAKAVNPAQKFIPVSGDLGSSSDRTALLDQVLQAYDGQLDALVNNAGMAPRVRADVTATTEESFDELIGVNLKGPYFLTQLVANHWLKNPTPSAIPSGRKVAFVSSVSANTASIGRGEYCISKAGLAMASSLWATRLAPEGIQVIEFRPGIMMTDMTTVVKDKYDALIADGLVPQRRWGNPGDVGRAVRAFLDGDLSFSSGAVIDIDGGLQIRRL
ncbi:NAD(P)-dependent dehydrogenase, short-chain alcohol dehydrogenase family [Verrucomicrobium sp. GAS474]|nr:NAD(P)-dependent dehydrogenase, short-chain alcohol dehydrogenase family [Verrucomicrobium sp. GAS474]